MLNPPAIGLQALLAAPTRVIRPVSKYGTTMTTGATMKKFGHPPVEQPESLPMDGIIKTTPFPLQILGLLTTHYITMLHQKGRSKLSINPNMRRPIYVPAKPSTKNACNRILQQRCATEKIANLFMDPLPPIMCIKQSNLRPPSKK